MTEQTINEELEMEQAIRDKDAEELNDEEDIND